jgi:nicotinate-nucleotide--dimethylbenzimidazole phosphoribosyltransferase
LEGLYTNRVHAAKGTSSVTRSIVSTFADLDSIRALCADLPNGSESAAVAVAERQTRLTKPAGSLGRLEELAAWLARWQERPLPLLDRVEVLVFAGNHGVTAHHVSPYPASVTEQMVANFERGGAAINQIARVAGATLRVFPLALDCPTRDFTLEPAMTEAEFVVAASVGYDAVEPGTDLICLGDMGIGNTTSASAVAAALFGGDGTRWAGRGTGVNDAGLARKRGVIDLGLARHAGILADPLQALRALGGRELAAIFGAALAARYRRVPVLLDGFVCTAAVAPLAVLQPKGLAHAQMAHLSAEAGHRLLAEALGERPIFDLGMRLGEGSAAALAVPVLRAAVACHADMATFAEAAVDNRD